MIDAKRNTVKGNIDSFETT